MSDDDVGANEETYLSQLMVTGMIATVVFIVNSLDSRILKYEVGSKSSH